MSYNNGMMKKYPTSMRLTPTAKWLIEKLSDNLGISNSAVIEVAIRNLAKDYGIEVHEETEGGGDAQAAS